MCARVVLRGSVQTLTLRPNTQGDVDMAAVLLKFGADPLLKCSPSPSPSPAPSPAPSASASALTLTLTRTRTFTLTLTPTRTLTLTITLTRRNPKNDRKITNGSELVRGTV